MKAKLILSCVILYCIFIVLNEITVTTKYRKKQAQTTPNIKKEKSLPKPKPEVKAKFKPSPQKNKAIKARHDKVNKKSLNQKDSIPYEIIKSAKDLNQKIISEDKEYRLTGTKNYDTYERELALFRLISQDRSNDRHIRSRLYSHWASVALPLIKNEVKRRGLYNTYLDLILTRREPILLRLYGPDRKKWKKIIADIRKEGGQTYALHLDKLKLNNMRLVYRSEVKKNNIMLSKPLSESETNKLENILLELNGSPIEPEAKRIVDSAKAQFNPDFSDLELCDSYEIWKSESY